MILTGSGQNIYPEEIEDKLNNMYLVLESLVLEHNGKLHALVVPDYEQAEREGVDKNDLPQIMENNQRVEYGRGRLRTCRSDHDLPHRIREDAQTQHQTLPLQRDAAGQITEKGRTAVKSAAGRPRRLIIHPPLVLSGFIRHIACRIFRRV